LVINPEGDRLMVSVYYSLIGSLELMFWVNTVGLVLEGVSILKQRERVFNSQAANMEREDIFN
jgi:hypothetical protein